VNTKQREKRMG